MSRSLWTVTFVLCVLAIVAGGTYAYLLPGEQGSPAPLLLAVPLILLAGLSWRRLRRRT
jgi:hypothetical protein